MEWECKFNNQLLCFLRLPLHYRDIGSLSNLESDGSDKLQRQEQAGFVKYHLVSHGGLWGAARCVA